ncbi:hypothetical protein ES288_D12G143300v1 [Gossypium darwinii]|uniref:Uncharacterized protein n=1 Tax=Gossypium darwinii TaxID=34276 RepID=A0A5D2AAU2_GOSDA|nr:hypothetical protein ES288_D12G143300v1 [Gossypium darwinii]
MHPLSNFDFDEASEVRRPQTGRYEYGVRCSDVEARVRLGQGGSGVRAREGCTDACVAGENGAGSC